MNKYLLYKRTVLIGLITAIGCLAHRPSMAACEDALVRSTYSSNSKVKDDWRLAILVTESAWNKAYHNGGVNFVLYGIPVGASYSDYNSRANSLMQSHNESYTHEQILNVAWTGLDPNSVTAYQSCLQLEAARYPGLHLGVRAADNSNILLLVSWTQPGAGPTQVVWTSPVIEGQPHPTNFRPGQTTIRVPRPRSNVNLAANVPGYTSEVVTLTPLLPPAPPAPLTAEMIRKKLIGTYQVRLGPRGGCNGGRPYSFPSAPAHIVTEGSDLSAYNECGSKTSVRIGDDKTIYFFGEHAELDLTGGNVIIKADDLNSWQKVGGP